MPSQQPDQYRTWASEAVGALQRWYNPRTGLWRTAGWWNSANALTAVIQHSQRTGEHAYRYVIETTFTRAERVNRGFSNLYFDDDGWWALAWTGPFDRADAVRQGSALDAFNAAVDVTDPAASGPAY